MIPSRHLSAQSDNTFMSERTQKVSGEIQKLVAEFLNRNANRSSMITATGVSVSRDLAKAQVLVSVLPEEKEDEAIAFLKRSERDAREYLKSRGSFKNAPSVSFELDRGEKNRRRIEELS